MALGGLLDIITLINKSVSFIIYVMMSSAFKETFCKMFKKYIPVIVKEKQMLFFTIVTFYFKDLI